MRSFALQRSPHAGLLFSSQNIRHKASEVVESLAGESMTSVNLLIVLIVGTVVGAFTGLALGGLVSDLYLAMIAGILATIVAGAPTLDPAMSPRRIIRPNAIRAAAMVRSVTTWCV
jgi:hypothetical protein